jgi:hypothetical protein
MASMRVRMRARWVLAAFLVSAMTRAALASPSGTLLNWFSSRPLSQQTSWSTPGDHAELMRKAYILSQFSDRAYLKSESKRAPELFGFRELRVLDENKKVDGGDIGAFIGAGAGGLIDVVSGGGTLGLGTLVAGIIGHRAIKRQTVGARAIVLGSLDGRTRVVSIKGSLEMPDWMLDANASTVADKFYPVTYHHGFFLYASALIADVRKEVADACSADGPDLWLTGHSLGGAAAELIAYWLARSGCKVTGVMTFGAPLPGMKDLEVEYNRLLGGVTHRFMHEDDPVACLPMGLNWAKVGAKHSFTDKAIHFYDTRDLCSAGGPTLDGQAHAFATKLHDLADPSTEFAVWMDTTAKASGLCPDTKLGKWAFGLLTLGGSNLTCKSIEWGADAAVLAQQLEQLSVLLLDMSNPYKHMMQCGYIDPIAVHGSEMDVFTDPIWQEKMEATWELTDCHPPPPRTGPFELMELCKAPLVCCGNEFVNLTLDSGQKVRKCVDRCVTDANDCSL